ncbi:MAG: protein kinase [Acidobacteria bacterium]|nr:protein kinase [Acidobacteriota bacterium]
MGHYELAPFLCVLALAMPYQGRRRWLPPLVAGGVVVVVTNLSALSLWLPGLRESLPAWAFSRLQPGLAVVGNTVALAFFIWSAVRLLSDRDANVRMAGRLKRRGDWRGAGDLYLRAGYRRRALAAFTKGRAWTEAARVCLELGRDREAADLLRKAGGRHLQEAARLYSRCGADDQARRCYQGLARWLTDRGNLGESIAPWVRAGEPMRAVRAALAALSAGRINPSTAEFEAARRAADSTRNHELMARLAEAEANWRTAAQAWLLQGDAVRAAESFVRGGDLTGAAQALDDAGRLREAAQLRLQQLARLRERDRQLAGGQSADAKDARLRADAIAEKLLPRLEQLGMEEQYLQVLMDLGRFEEAVEWLIQRDRRADAAELAVQGQRWDLAGPLLEKLGRWGEASDVYELEGKLAEAGRCAELAGEDERALNIFRRLGDGLAIARCLARIGRLQEALTELHRAGRLQDAAALLREHPGPVPDIPDVILDMAEDLRSSGRLDEAIACLQRAVVGVALQSGRLEAATALARLLLDAGDVAEAQAHIRRILESDYAYTPAHELQRRIQELVTTHGPAATRPPATKRAVGPAMPSFEDERYEILTELGRGGMGVVYQAHDTRLERIVAVKVLRATAAQEVSQLEREAKAAATLNHPAIVTVYDFERGLGGYLIAMEFVRGESMDVLLRTSPERIRGNLLPILLQLAEAVAYAHDHHVIHRDLKPGNILLTADHRVKIFDFGIAARLDSDAGPSGGICGTPFYMSPEQIRGEAPTPQSDIYSLGATFFHLATGRPPFARGNVIEAHLDTPPPVPTEINPELPPALSDILLRCLKKEPGERYPSGRELRDVLKGI